MKSLVVAGVAPAPADPRNPLAENPDHHHPPGRQRALSTQEETVFEGIMTLTLATRAEATEAVAVAWRLGPILYSATIQPVLLLPPPRAKILHGLQGRGQITARGRGRKVLGEELGGRVLEMGKTEEDR